MSINSKYIYILLILFSVAALGMVFIGDYAGLRPCPLCIYQRFAYMILIILAIIALLVIQHSYLNILLNNLLAMTVIGAIILTGYHVGVEHKLFVQSSICTQTTLVSSSSYEEESTQNFIAKLADSQEIGSCDQPELIILGLSIAEWNLISNIMILVLILSTLHYRSRQQ